MTKPPPTLLSLTIETALLHLSSFSDLSPIPDHILLELFVRTLRAGKLNEKILKLFIATGQDEVLAFIHELNIQPIITPVLPTQRGRRHSIKSLKKEWEVVKLMEKVAFSKWPSEAVKPKPGPSYLGKVLSML